MLSAGIKCPICSKFVLPDEIECHLIMCLTKPRISYNGKIDHIGSPYTLQLLPVARYVLVTVTLNMEMLILIILHLRGCFILLCWRMHNLL